MSQNIKVIKGLHERVFIDYSKAPYNITKEINQSFKTRRELYNYLEKLEQDINKNPKLAGYNKDYETQEEFDSRVITAFKELLQNHPKDLVAIIIAHKEVFKTISTVFFGKEIALLHAEAKLYNF